MAGWVEVSKGHWPGDTSGGGFVAHSPTKSKVLPWCWCRRCGLIYLRNEFTDWCITRGCNYDEHPQYKSTMKRLTGQKREC